MYLQFMSTFMGRKLQRSLTIPNSLTAAGQGIEVVSGNPASVITDPTYPVFAVDPDVDM